MALHFTKTEDISTVENFIKPQIKARKLTLKIQSGFYRFNTMTKC